MRWLLACGFAVRLGRLRASAARPTRTSARSALGVCSSSPDEADAPPHFVVETPRNEGLELA